MDRNARHSHAGLAIRVPLGPLVIEVFYINYEAAIPGWGYGNHAHSSYELHFVSRGQGTLRVGDQWFSIGPGTLYLTGPGVYHEQQADRTDPMNEYCLNFDFSMSPPTRNKVKAYLPEEIEEIRQALSTTTFWFGRDQSTSVAAFERVFEELDTRRIGYYATVQSLLSLIVVNAVRCFAGNREASSSIPPRMVNDSRRLLLDHYFQRLDQPRSRLELAGILGTSVRHLNRILVDTFGLSFRQKLDQSRLDLASDLLHHSNLSIEEVAARVGFSRGPTFAKAFRRHLGLSPSAHRLAAGIIIR